MRTMKHFLSLLLFLVINIHAYASDDGVIRILAIGNSFSQDAIENYLHQLAEASGKQTIIANMYIGGCTLERHYNNAQNNTAAYSYRKIGVDGMKVSKEGVTLEEVAQSLDITPEYLSTLFNREMGENFSNFLKKFRMSHAKRLLRETDKKIGEIAIEVGYSDPKYFNRVFKAEEGISPGEFRALDV